MLARRVWLRWQPPLAGLAGVTVALEGERVWRSTCPAWVSALMSTMRGRACRGWDFGRVSRGRVGAAPSQPCPGSASHAPKNAFTCDDDFCFIRQYPEGPRIG